MSNSSKDSGLDDSAQNGAAVAPIGPATRLSWFLAEVDDGMLSNGEANGRKRLCVLHSMELLETDVSDKYMTRFVEFRLNGVKLEAKLILAADERKLVDAALISLSQEMRDEDDDARQMLVQYEEEDLEAGNRLIQKMVSPHTVTWLSTNSEISGAPIVKLEQGEIAHVLYAYEQRDYMEKVMLNLKARCFDHVFDEQLEAAQATLDENTWMLVQYSPEPEMVVYQVIPYTRTIWKRENAFKDVIAYLPGEDAILQAVVISYAQDWQSIQQKYDQLRRFALDMEFPLQNELDLQFQRESGTTALFARNTPTLFQRAEHRDSSGEHKQLRRSLEQMNERAQNEAELIIEAFDMVDNINRNLQNRLDSASTSASATSSD